MTTSPRVPVLAAGDTLTRDEFERRYAAMPDLQKAELIEGVVYMGSPVSLVRHGRPQRLLASWLTFYELPTPGPFSSDNTTVRLDLDNEPQPDLLLCIPSAAGGSSPANGLLAKSPVPRAVAGRACTAARRSAGAAGGRRVRRRRACARRIRHPVART